MPIDSRLDKVKELLASGKTEEAADLLLELGKECDEVHYSSALMIKNQLEHLQQDGIDGVLSANEQNIGWAKVSRRILRLTQQIEKGEKPQNSEGLLPPAQKTKPVTPFPKWLLWGLPVILLVGIFGINNLSKGKPANKVVPIEKRGIPEMEMVDLEGRLIYPNQQPAGGVEVILEPLTEGLLQGKKDIRFTTKGDGTFNFKYPQNLERKHVKISFMRGEKTLNVITEFRFMAAKFKEMRIPD